MLFFAADQSTTTTSSLHYRNGCCAARNKNRSHHTTRFAYRTPVTTSLRKRHPLRIVPSSLALRHVQAPDKLSSCRLDGTSGRNSGMERPVLALAPSDAARRRWKSLSMSSTVKSLLHLYGGGGGIPAKHEEKSSIPNVVLAKDRVNTCVIRAKRGSAFRRTGFPSPARIALHLCSNSSRYTSSLFSRTYVRTRRDYLISENAHKLVDDIYQWPPMRPSRKCHHTNVQYRWCKTEYQRHPGYAKYNPKHTLGSPPPKSPEQRHDALALLEKALGRPCNSGEKLVNIPHAIYEY